MSEIEVFLALDNRDIRVGTIFREPSREREKIAFEYHPTWVENSNAFSLEPVLKIREGRFHLRQDKEIFGSLGDSAPDTWGRRLMQRVHRRKAKQTRTRLKTLHEVDYLLGVSDIVRLGALRFKHPKDDVFQAPIEGGVPKFVHLGQLLSSVHRIERDQHTDEDLNMVFAPGSSLGGARPKVAVVDSDGNLAIAKFPKENDEYSLETWEHIGLLLAEEAGITVARHRIFQVNDRAVLLSRRFDRVGSRRIPFLSALSMLGLSDRDRSSYPEIVDELTKHGSDFKADASELFRRMVFNILVSNVDDHLRNHGFLWTGRNGWRLSPAYDINPTPVDRKVRILSTNISLDEATCSIELALEQAELFGLSKALSHRTVSEVAIAVSSWRKVAARVGESRAAVDRMSSAFEHEDLETALNLT